MAAVEEGLEAAGLEAGVYFIINRWRADQGESRAGQYVGFIGHDVQLEATRVGWQLVPAGKPNRNRAGLFSPG